MAKSTGGYCSFCGRSGRDVRLLINGINGSICDECAQQAYEMVKEKFAESSSFTMSMSELPTPEDIKLFLDQYVIGQDAAKQYLAVSVYNHYKRLMQKVTADDVEIEKSNMLMTLWRRSMNSAERRSRGCSRSILTSPALLPGRGVKTTTRSAM